MSIHDNKASFGLPLSPSSGGKKNQPQKTATTTTKQKQTMDSS
jgi:hypothetical protein